MRKTNPAGIALIKHYEGLRLQSYLDSVKVPTIGYGHTGPEVQLGQTITQDQAEQLFSQDLKKFEDGVEKLLPVTATDNQFSACVSFSYNLGLQTLKNSTLLKKFLAGDISGAALEFDKWVHAGGHVLPGLVERRAKERELFVS